MARVYVGTYGKYNRGSIKGAWLNLDDYNTYGDFLKKCGEVHKDERDPEFMIQDTEDFPDGLSCMEWLSEQDFNDVKLAMKEEEQESEGKPAINIIDYSDKSFAVVGDTFPIRKELKQMGGCFNKRLSCGAGWIFSNKSREAVEKYIQSGEVTNKVLSDKPQTNEGKQFVEWLKEFAATESDNYYLKHSVGAIKMHGSYYLIEKPGIENRFSFHDEGPQYEFYKELMQDNKKLEEYFKSENLARFDNMIKHIEKGDGYNADKSVWWYKGKDDWEKHLYLDFYRSHVEDYETECTEEERQLILKGLKWARDLFEKRLDAYLKRYGTSKLHTWTYWADA